MRLPQEADSLAFHAEEKPGDQEALAQDGSRKGAGGTRWESERRTSSKAVGPMGGATSPFSSRAGTERLRGPGPGFVSTRSGLPGRLEEQQGAFPAGREPLEARAFSESERSGRGARPRRGPGG